MTLETAIGRRGVRRGHHHVRHRVRPDVVIDGASQVIIHGSKAERLTATEFAIVAYLTQNSPRRVRRNELLDNVAVAGPEALSAILSQMRRKLNRLGLRLLGGHGGAAIIEADT